MAADNNTNILRQAMHRRRDREWGAMNMAKSEPCDPFRYLPDLRPHIEDPSGSRYRDIDYTVLDRAVANGGTSWRRSDDEREATRKVALTGRSSMDLWVFAYGSLMWDPGIHFSEIRRAWASGYHRSFCLRSDIGRGSKERPGLMAALDTGGECQGLAFRITAADIDGETHLLWRREMIAHAYIPRFIDLQTPQGPLEALAFVMDQNAPRYVPGLSLAETARFIGTGKGPIGTSLEYLDSLVAHFAVLDIVDDELAELHELATHIAAQVDDTDT